MYFQVFEYLTSLFYNMTIPEEVNSDKDDDIDSFFIVQNPTATVSVLKQQPVWDVQSFYLFPKLKELFIRPNTPLSASLHANDYSVRRTNFHAKMCNNFRCELRTSADVEAK